MATLPQVVLNKISYIMDLESDISGKPLRWFFSFGTLEEYIADLTFGLDYDIDIGVLYRECNINHLTRVFEDNGFKKTAEIIHDIDKKPLNVHFKPIAENLVGVPSVDVYLWYEHKGYLYHTYDVDREKKKIPSRYFFKGIPKEYIVPPKEYVEDIRKNQSLRNLITEDGVWKYDVWGECSGYIFRCPFAYGSCLDVWYPNWRFRKYCRDQSKTHWPKIIKTCKDF